ncbi:MAG: DUF1294 domain-containing protein [Chloroflexi bacterium]|nr:DUF1294 domain-containing protein [Chloroflexota bacterium]
MATLTTQLELMASYLLIVNTAAFLAYVIDKRRAKTGRRRIKESQLLALALVGGSPGALAAMLLFHHKTRKNSFRLPFALIVTLQFALALLFTAIRPIG